MKPWPDDGHDFYDYYSGVFENYQGYASRVLIENVSRSVLHPTKVKMGFIDYNRKV